MDRLLQRQRDAIAQMFGAIAPRYDFLNHLLSLGTDVRWRQFAVRWLPAAARLIVDIGTGTGDFAFAALSRCPQAQVIGVDVSLPMLRIARHKAARHAPHRCTWVLGDALQLPLPDQCADAILCAFALRNFSDIDQGLREMVRVLVPGGVAVMLEFCRPPTSWWRTPIGVFVRYAVPLMGRWLSQPLAYAYLTASISTFASAEEIAERMQRAQFRAAFWLPLTFGVATLFWGVR